MSKSRARYLAELLTSDGLVKVTTTALTGVDGIIDPEVLPTIANSQLEHSSISIAGHTLSLGGSLSLDTSDITEHASYLYYTDARVRGALSVSGSLAYNSSTGVISYTTPTTIASLSNHDTDDLSEGATNLYWTTARGNSNFDTRLGTKTTTNLTEGTNLYYTDARVGSYLTTNSYATQTYVNTAVSNLVDSAPATLDTLNELAAALGDDPNFATTVTNSIATKLPLAGGTLSGDLIFEDNNKAIFGAGSDLQIFHDGSYSYIKESGTGDLRIQGSTNVQIWNSALDKQAANFNAGGSQTLFYDNAAKLATTSTGIDVTGTVTADGLTVDGSRSNFAPNSENFAVYLQYNSATSGFYVGSPSADAMAFSASSGAERMRIDSSGNVGIGTSSLTEKLTVVGTTKVGEGVASNTSKLMVNTASGTAAGIQLFQDANESWIIQNPASTTALTFANSGTERARIDSSGNLILGGTTAITDTGTPSLTLGNGAGNPSLNFYGTSAGQAGQISFGDATSGTGAYEGYLLYDNANNFMAFGTNHTERMRIDSSGNVGIGADNHITFGPNSTWGSSLRVGGNGRTATGTEMASVVTTDGNLHLDAAASDNGIYLNYYAGTNGTLFGNGASAIVARMDSAGQLYKSSTTANPYWNSANDGSGSGLDADLLDGIDSGSFLRSDTTDSFTGDELHFPTLDLSISNNNSQNQGNTYFRGDGNHFVLGLNNGNTFYCNYGNASGAFRLDGNVYVNSNFAGNVLWGNSNDGSGSGLDADLLDGVQGSGYQTRLLQQSSSNLVLATGNAGAGGLFLENSSGQFIFQLYGNQSQYGFLASEWGSWDIKKTPGGNMVLNNSDSNIVWHAGNDGSGSGLDADLLDGLQLHTGRNNEANKVVRTDVNGYIQAGWINTTSGDSGVATRLTRIYSSHDGYLRYSTLTDFKVHMGLPAKNNYSRRIDFTTDSNYWVGSFGNNGYGANETFHGGSGFFDIWSGTNYPSGLTHIHGFNALHYTTNSLGTTGGVAYGWQMAGQYNIDNAYFRTCSGGSFSAWRKFWHDGNDGSGSGLDADLLDGLNSTAFVQQGGTYYTNGNTAAFASANDTTLSVRSNGPAAATMSFHKPGVFAANFGIDTDNQLKYGGWSAVDVHPVMHDGVFGGSVSNATNGGGVNYVYVDGTVSYAPTRGSCGNHVYQCWGGALTLTLNDASWQRGDIVVLSNVRGAANIVVNAYVIYMPNGSNDNQVTWNATVGSFRLCKYSTTVGYWMVLP